MKDRVGTRSERAGKGGYGRLEGGGGGEGQTETGEQEGGARG